MEKEDSWPEKACHQRHAQTSQCRQSNKHHGTVDQKIVKPLLGYLHKIKKQADQAYKISLWNG
ncbi:hypothetical protein AAG747_24685 [Rapidithrix thailandica]|uniref:Uncharacterized protein n=1 Tax=Rapidithrix thailandica TaxID=413964 RepID=A0AAW9S1U6_9BACT